MTRRRLLPLLVLLLLALLIAGCGDDESNDDTDGRDRSTTTTTTTSSDRDDADDVDTPDDADDADDDDDPKLGSAEDVTAKLKVDIRANGGTGAPTVSNTITCPIDHYATPATRTACALLDGSPDVVAPPAETGTACAAVIDGPETATVTGTLEGAQIKTTFRRTDACESERWDNAEPLFEAVGFDD